MRTLCFVVLFGLAAPALAQEAATAPQAAADVDEIIVPGVKPENLSAEIERLEGSVYARFNALNSNDEFDIHCFKQAPTGSNIPLRRCAPNFVVEAEAAAAKNQLSGARSNANANSRNARDNGTILEQKSRELTEEIQRLAREDEQLMRDLVRLDQLKQQQQATEKPARRSGG